MLRRQTLPRAGAGGRHRPAPKRSGLIGPRTTKPSAVRKREGRKGVEDSARSGDRPRHDIHAQHRIRRQRPSRGHRAPRVCPASPPGRLGRTRSRGHLARRRGGGAGSPGQGGPEAIGPGGGGHHQPARDGCCLGQGHRPPRSSCHRLAGSPHGGNMRGAAKGRARNRRPREDRAVAGSLLLRRPRSRGFSTMSKAPACAPSEASWRSARSTAFCCGGLPVARSTRPT